MQITYVAVVRTEDGLMLSESTDADQYPEQRCGKKILKSFVKSIKLVQDMSIVRLSACNILLTAGMGVSYMISCDESYPVVLAFAFLDELQREFTSAYRIKTILSAIRPYAFIDFDVTIRQLKQRYNNPRSLTTRLNLGQMSEELKKNPPQEIALATIQSKREYGINCTYVDPIKQFRSDPISSFGWISIAVTTVCAFFNFSRGLIFLSSANWDGFDRKSPVTGIVFMIEALLEACQICLLMYQIRLKVPISLIILLVFAFFSLQQQHVKNGTQLITQVACAAFITVHIYFRKIHSKLQHYNV